MKLLTKTYIVDRRPGVDTSALIEYVFTIKEEFLRSFRDHPQLIKLVEYLEHVFFNDISIEFVDKISASQAKPIIAQYKASTEGDLTSLAKKVPYKGQGKNQHATLQEYFLKSDRSVIATEVPVYHATHSGHIDLLAFQLDPFKVLIYDFKPNAGKEDFEKVLAQLYWYRDMLSTQTTIPRQLTDCYFFDDKLEVKASF